MMHTDAHRNWSVRPLAETDLEAYLDIYLNAYPAYKDLDQACRDHYREKHRRELREDTHMVKHFKPPDHWERYRSFDYGLTYQPFQAGTLVKIPEKSWKAKALKKQSLEVA